MSCYHSLRMPNDFQSSARISRPHSSGRSGILLAANRLPVSVEETQWGWHFSESPGGLVSALKGTHQPFTWVGWPGRAIPAKAHATVREHLAGLDTPFSLEPLFFDSDETDLHYNGFSNRVIWPVFHGLNSSTPFRQEYWAAYRRVNEVFAHRLFHSALAQLSRQTNPEPVRIWIHDYQLLLVPRILRRMLEKAHVDRDVRIGFFLHIPFPPPEEFRRIPTEIRIKLLQGLLGSDLLGVHDASYREELLNCFSGELGVEPRGLQIPDGARLCRLGVYPIGITPSHFSAALSRAKFNGTLARIQQRYSGRKMILGVDRLDPAKGLLNKLEAYRLFLASRPGAASETCLVQIAVPSRTGIPEYQELTQELLRRARSINEQFTPPAGPAPVDIRHESVGRVELSALYHAADVMLITSLRDGMNLVSLESVACQKGRERPSAVVISRTTGAARWLSGALKTNPEDSYVIADDLISALGMSTSQRVTRARDNLAYVESRTAERWARRFLEDLEKIPAQ